MAVLEKEDFWGGKLSKSSPQVQFNPDFDESELSEVDHKLILSQACLGGKATGRNIIEVTALDYKGDECTHTIVSLKEGSVEMCTLNLTFNAPATFKLIEGSGPVHLTGSHVQSLTEEEDNEDSEEESDEEAPELVDTDKQKKRPLPVSTPKGPPNKMAKVEKEESEEEESDDEEESDEDEKEAKKPVVKKDKKEESKKPSKQVKKDAEEDEESEEESDDDDEDDDEEDEDMESDEDEEESNDDDDDESDEEEEDEVTANLTGKKKGFQEMKKQYKGMTRDLKWENKYAQAKKQENAKKPLTNGVASKKAEKEAKKTPQAKTPQAKIPQQKTPQTKTPQPTKDLETIKQALLKSPALPKKLEKFQNFMRSSYKITDKDTVNEVWEYVQKNKK